MHPPSPCNADEVTTWLQTPSSGRDKLRSVLQKFFFVFYIKSVKARYRSQARMLHVERTHTAC